MFQTGSESAGEMAVKGVRLGYAGVSSKEQNPGRQLDGVELDMLFTDRVSEGDQFFVHSMDRLAREPGRSAPGRGSWSQGGGR